MRRLAPAAALVLSVACASAPPPTAAARRLAQNPRATVEGRVTDANGHPVAGLRVEAVPGGRDILWSPAAPTDREGRFRLSLDAPAEYAFLVYEDAVAVVTLSPSDPARVRVFVNAGETKKGIELTFLRAEREKLIAPAP